MPDQPKTLADYLGVAPDGAEQPPLEVIEDGKTFGLAVLNSVEFRSYILNGLRLGNLPGFASILGRLMDHALGKPIERVEHTNVPVAPEELTAEELEERANRLTEMAKFMRRAEQFNEPPATDSVH